VDTQELLPFGSVEDVEQEVLRLRRIFGKNYICSPSHEALLPNVSPEKLLMMSRTATRIF
jgi:uroporphyrinogen decarboxylase